jgi:hypothetical protein
MSLSTITNESETHEYNRNSKNALNGKKVSSSKQSVISSSEGSYLNPLDQIHENCVILPITVQKQQHSFDTKSNLPKRTKKESRQCHQEQQTPCKKLNHDKKTMNNHFDSKSTECMNELETVPAF